jgi:phenylalanyl-tRNA synthetase alpha subunit
LHTKNLCDGVLICGFYFMSEEKKQVEEIKSVFEREFARFADLRGGENLNGLSLRDAENLQRELGELRVRHTGKKSEIAGAKKLIGRVAAEERGAFGQFVQSVEKEIVTAIEEAEDKLKTFIAEAKTERERLDVTLPGRRPRAG